MTSRIVPLVLVLALGAACKSTTGSSGKDAPKEPATEPAKAPPDNTSIVADPVSGVPREMEVYTPDPKKATKREIPPDGVLRLTQLQFITAMPDVEKRCPDIDSAVAFINAAEQIVREHDAATPGALGATVYVWIAIKPGNQSRAWITGEPEVTLATEQAIAARISAGRAPITAGPVVLMFPMHRRQVEGSGDFPKAPDLWVLAAQPGDTGEQAALRAWDEF